MKLILVAAILLCLVGISKGEQAAFECIECWDSLRACEVAGDLDCCKEARDRYCDGCDEWRAAYDSCRHVDETERHYLKYRFRKEVDIHRQRFMDEMENLR